MGHEPIKLGSLFSHYSSFSSFLFFYYLSLSLAEVTYRQLKEALLKIVTARRYGSMVYHCILLIGEKHENPFATANHKQRAATDVFFSITIPRNLLGRCQWRILNLNWKTIIMK
jgi:hypothetical protein